MIQFVHQYIQSILNIDPMKVNVVVVENPNFLVSLVEDIKQFLNKYDTEVRFLENNEIYKKIDKMFLLTDIFDIEFNSKLLQNVLIKKLSKGLDGYEFSINKIYESAYQIFSKALQNLNVSVDVNPMFEKSAFVKMFSPTIQSDFDSLIEKLTSFVSVLVELIDLRCLIVVNLHEFLNFEECKQFYHHCKGRDVSVLNFQSRKKYSFDDEQTIIIDNDLCEIVADIDNL